MQYTIAKIEPYEPEIHNDHLLMTVVGEEFTWRCVNLWRWQWEKEWNRTEEQFTVWAAWAYYYPSGESGLWHPMHDRMVAAWKRHFDYRIPQTYA